jgi:hypothetical protein
MKRSPSNFIVFPAKAGTQGNSELPPWIPAFAGMTEEVGVAVP